MERLRTVLPLLIMAAVLNTAYHVQASDASDVRQGRIGPAKMYTKDLISFQAVSGALFSPTALASRTPVLSYAQTNLRLGWMLNNPSLEPSFLRGNFEAILELSNSIIFKGFGNYIGGITALIRYNFVQPDWKLVPYFQVGAGIVYTDAYKDLTQNAIGQAIEFTPQGSFGIRCLISKNWSIDAEAMFHHISNAGLDERNRGINAFGGFIGVTYFTDWSWK